MAEDVYKKLNEMRKELNALRETVERVDDQTTQNRALLEALADQQGIDVDTVLAQTAIEEAEPTADDGTEPGAADETGTATDDTSDSPTDAANANGGTTGATDDTTDGSA